MLLVWISFKHYGPKDSEEGTKEIVIANDLDQAIAYIDKEYLFGGLSEADQDGDSADFSPDDDFWEPGQKEEAIALGLTVSKSGYVKGSSTAMTKWLKGTYWQDVSDAYYGVTHWNWHQNREITPEEAAVLLKLGVAKDIREWKPE